MTACAKKPTAKASVCTQGIAKVGGEHQRGERDQVLHRIEMRLICHKAACVPGSQPRPGSILARSTAHRPETRRNRAHFAARTRRNFLSFSYRNVVVEVVRMRGSRRVVHPGLSAHRL